MLIIYTISGRILATHDSRRFNVKKLIGIIIVLLILGGPVFIWNFCRNGLDRAALFDAAMRRYGAKYGRETVERTLETFLRRIVSQAFKRNCAPDGIRVFSFDFSRDGWWIPSDMPVGCL